MQENIICKVCKSPLFLEPILSYKNMPSVAQHLPTAETVKNDTGVDLDIYQCSGCGLVQLNIKPVPYYKEVIRAVGYSAEMKAFRQKQFKTFIEQYSLKGKKIIEIGAGRGEYLALMQEAGAYAYGIEFGEESVKACKDSGLNVEKGFIDSENFKIPNAPFEAFFIISFFEHLPNPNQALKGIYNNLVDDAVGIIEVPNFDMMLREHLFSEFMRDHLFYFTQNTLRTTLELNGFEILKMEEVWHNYIISAEVCKIPNFTPKNFSGNTKKIDLSSFSEFENKIKKELNDFIGQYKNLAIWGAGHQAFAIMAMMELGGKIKYVLDSAPFKQGKLTPASHIPIVAPDTLNSDPVDAVIIMAGSYSDEIKKIVREKYNPKLKIAILRESGLEVI